MLKPSIFIFFLIYYLLIHQVAFASRGIKIQPISPTGDELKGHQWLFVIGINNYTIWPRLKTAVNDAKSIKKALIDRYYFDHEHLVELYDELATRNNILNKLRFLAKHIREDDSLVIFYAGHGHFDDITKEGSWIPVDSAIKDVSGWISNHEIKTYLNIDAIKAKHILLISDSCFSGDFFRGYRGLPEVTDKVLKKAYKLTSRQAITSGGLEPVTDEGFGGNSVFSHFLVKALNQNEKPFLVPSEFFPEITAGVVENAEQFPSFGSLKGTGGQQGGELVLFLNNAPKTKEATGQTQQDRLDVEIVDRERTLSELDAKIDAMNKKLDRMLDEPEEENIPEKQLKHINDIIEKFKHRNEDIKQDAIDELVEIGTPAVKPLIVALNNKDEDVREYAADALGDIGDIRAVDPLIAKLQDKREGKWIRGNSANALGIIGDPRAVNSLTEALGDKDLYVRLSSSVALSDLGDKDWINSEAAKNNIPDFIDALEDDDEWTKKDAAAALGNMGNKRTLEPLFNVFKNEDEEVSVRIATAIALENIGDENWASSLVAKKAVPDFIKALKDDEVEEDVSWNIADALEKITGKDFGKNYEKWEKWWKIAKKRFLMKKRRMLRKLRK